MVMIYRVDLSQVCLFTYPPPPTWDWQVKYLCYTLTHSPHIHVARIAHLCFKQWTFTCSLSSYLCREGRLYEVVSIRSQLKARVLSQ